MISFVRCALALAATAFLSVTASAQSQDKITLRLKGGGFDVTGSLIRYDGNKYEVSSDVFGIITLEATRFDCIRNCPDRPFEARPAFGSQQEEIAVAGSNTVGNALMPALIQGYAKSANLGVQRIVGENPLDLQFRLSDKQGREVAVIDLRRHGSSTSFRELDAGTAAIGMSSRRIKDTEVEKLRPKYGDFKQPGRENVVALDGLMILVSPDNPLNAISLDNVAKIFSGQITDWSELNQPPGKIDLYAPTPDSGTFDTFKSLVLKAFKVKLDARTKRTPDHAQQSDWVARDRFGIGVVGIAYQRNSKALNIKTQCGLITEPSVFAMKTEEYPLSRRLYLYAPARQKTVIARQLLSFSLSKAAQSIVQENDFINQSPDALPFESQMSRLTFAMTVPNDDFDMALVRIMLDDLKGAERLSSTFRFRTGSAWLDAKAAADVGRVVDTLRSNPYQSKQIILAGFADSVGTFSDNTGLARSRAVAVRNAILATEGGRDLEPRLSIKSYSELAPVACNDNDERRSFNRRVEVWLK